MECLYVPELGEQAQEVELSDTARLRHIRALRLRRGELLLLSNGRGRLVQAVIEQLRSDVVRLRVRTQLEPSGELPVPIGVAVGLLHERERLEFALEKAVELGVRQIVLLCTRYTTAQTVRMERLQRKLIAALEQSHRAWLPTLLPPMSLQELLSEVAPRYAQLVFPELEGDVPTPLPARPTLLVVGPEGGWAESERRAVGDCSLPVFHWRLAPRRLRSETALIAALALVTAALQPKPPAQ